MENSDETVVEIVDKIIDTNAEVTKTEIDARDKEIDALRSELEKTKKERDEAVNTMRSMTIESKPVSEFDEIFNNKKGD